MRSYYHLQTIYCIHKVCVKIIGEDRYRNEERMGPSGEGEDMPEVISREILKKAEIVDDEWKTVDKATEPCNHISHESGTYEQAREMSMTQVKYAHIMNP